MSDTTKIESINDVYEGALQEFMELSKQTGNDEANDETNYDDIMSLPEDKLLRFKRVGKFEYYIQNSKHLIALTARIKAEGDNTQPGVKIKGLMYEYGPMVINVGTFEVDDGIFVSSIEYNKEHDIFILKCDEHK